MREVLNQNFLRKLRIMGLIEGISTLMLFGLAMPLKYLADFPLAVKVIGPVHGLLFLALVVMSCLAIRKVPLGLLWGVIGIIAAIIPFGPFLMEIHLKKLSQQY